MCLRFILEPITCAKDRDEVMPERFVAFHSRFGVPFAKSRQFVARGWGVFRREIARYFIDEAKRIDRFDFAQTFVIRDFVTELCLKLPRVIRKHRDFAGYGGWQGPDFIETIDLTKILGHISYLS